MNIEYIEHGEIVTCVINHCAPKTDLLYIFKSSFFFIICLSGIQTQPKATLGRKLVLAAAPETPIDKLLSADDAAPTSVKQL